jgi:hypothetical protein
MQILLAVCITLPAWAGVTNVTSGGPLYASLTQAVALAASGDELHVSTGAYFGNVAILGKNLTIAGGYAPDFSSRNFDPEATIISTSAVAPVVFIDAGARVLLEAVRITGGGIFLLWGGGVFIGDNCLVTARYCRIDHNTSLVGGGAAVWSNAVLVVHASWVDHNTALLEGGGIYAFLAARVALREPVACFDNWAPRGGGVTLCGASLTTHGPCDFDNNIAVECGGALYLFNGARADIASHAKFGWTTPNAATNGDGGNVHAVNSTLVVSGIYTRISTGRASGNGGSVYLSNSVFTLTGGAGIQSAAEPSVAGDCGGGVYMRESTLIVSNGHICQSVATNAGGGVYALHSRLDFLDARIGDTNPLYRNAADVGGGVYALDCTTRLVRATVVGNTAAGDGGGLYISKGVLDFTDSSAQHNAADADTNGFGSGGGIFADRGAVVNLTALNSNVTVAANTAVSGGGLAAISGVVTVVALPPRMCGFFENIAAGGYAGGGGYGGGLFADSGARVTVRGSLAVEANRARLGGGISAYNASTVVIEPTNGAGAVFANNVASAGGGAISALAGDSAVRIANARVGLPGQGNRAHGDNGGGGILAYQDSRLTAINCVFQDNVASNAGGGVCAWYCRSLVIDSKFAGAPVSPVPPTKFINNRSITGGGGGLMLGYNAGPCMVANALFASNWADYVGGAISMEAASNAQLVNVVVAHNATPYNGMGLGMSFNSEARMLQCTIANNRSNAVVVFDASTLVMTNCIIWGHAVSQIWGNAVVNYSDIQGGYPGTLNITNNPQFVNPAALNYQLAIGSPCIDQGAALPAITNDCIGTPRPYGTDWDMGAYEFVPEPAGLGLLGLFAMYHVRCTIWQRQRQRRRRRAT